MTPLDAAAAALQRIAHRDAKQSARSAYAMLQGRSNTQLPRMNPTHGQKRQLPRAVTTTAASLGIVQLQHIRRPQRWRFAAAPRADRDPRHPDFSRVLRDSRVFTTEREIDAWLDAALHASPIIKAAIPEAWLPLEDGALRKLTVQRGTLINWFVASTGPGDGVPSLPADFIIALRRVVETFAAYARRYGDAPYSPEPADTNGGYPLFVSHPAAKVVGAACFSGSTPGTLASLIDAESWVPAATGTPPEAYYGFGLGGRSGPFAKWTLDQRPTYDGAWIATEEMLGHSQRNRVVQMSAIAINRALGPLFRRLKGARRWIPGLWRDGVTDSAAHSSFPHTYEADISGFDASVTRELQETVAAELKRVWPELSEQIDVWLWAEARPLLTPSWSLDDDECGVLSSIGGTKSGLKLTSEMGTLYSCAAALYSLWKQGRAAQWPTQQDVSLAVQGDDVLVGSVTPLDVDLWAASYLSLNLRAELLTGDGFLARHNTANTPPVPSIGRFIQQTCSNEHEPTGSHADGLLLLGLYARTAGSHYWPQKAAAAAWDCIMQSPFYAALGHASLAACRRWIRTSDAAAKAIQASIADAASESWFAAIFRDAEHSPYAAAIAAALTSAGFTPATASMDRAVDTLMIHVEAQPESVRRAIVHEGVRAVSDGAPAADAWLQRFIATLPTKG